MAETDHAELRPTSAGGETETQGGPHQETSQKLTYVTGLLGLLRWASRPRCLLDSRYLLLLAPWVAAAHDLYIIGEDYSVKRIGAFLKVQGASED